MATNNYKKNGLMTTTQYARLTGISPSTALRAVLAKKIRAIKTPGGHFRIPIENVSLNPWWNYKPTKAEVAVAKEKVLVAFSKMGRKKRVLVRG